MSRDIQHVLLSMRSPVPPLDRGLIRGMESLENSSGDLPESASAQDKADLTCPHDAGCRSRTEGTLPRDRRYIQP
jgi:hypothetical protein